MEALAEAGFADGCCDLVRGEGKRAHPYPERVADRVADSRYRGTLRGLPDAERRVPFPGSGLM